MAGKAVISLTTGLEDPEKVTVAFLVAVADGDRRHRVCRATDKTYRLDTASARAFLGNYVTLP